MRFTAADFRFSLLSCALGAACATPALAGPITAVTAAAPAIAAVGSADTRASTTDTNTVATTVTAKTVTANTATTKTSSTDRARPNDSHEATTNPVENDSGDTQMTISRITVEGERTRHSAGGQVIGSVDVIGGDQIEKESVDMTLELLRKIPGVQYARFNQGVTSSNIALRGFNAEGEIHSTKLLIDGIPAQRNNGAHELDAVFPMEIAGIEVVKGSSDARYGQHSLAGNINVLTRQELDESRLRLLAGSFATTELQFASGHSNGNFNQSYFASWRETGGYREHAGVERKNLAGKWWLRNDSGSWRVGLVARDYELDADAPGYLSREETRRDPRHSPWFSASDGGNKAVQHSSLHLDGSLSEQLELQLRVYRQDVDFRRYVRFTAPESQQERLENETEKGALLNFAWQLDGSLAERVQLRAGVDHQAQEVVNERHRTQARVRQGAPTRNQFYTLDNNGAYLQADLGWDNGWRVQAGVRADQLDGHFINRSSGRRAPINRYGTLIQPKLGVLYDASDWNLFLNAGRGFQIGYGSAAYRTQTADLDASINRGIELGSRWQLGKTLSTRLSFWQQRASDEVRLKFDNSGDSENIGATERRGIDLLVIAELSRQFWLWGNYTCQQAELTNPGARDAALKGNSLHHVPEHIAGIGIDYRFADNWQFSSSFQYQSEYELNNANDAGRYGDQRHVQAELQWQQEAVTWTLHLKNLLDADNNYVWLDVSGPKFAAGDGRAAFLSADFRF